MIKALKIQWLGIRLALAGRLAYRADFVLSLLIMLAGDLLIPLVTLLIYRSGTAFPGWNLYEVLLIQGVFMISRGIASTLFFGLVSDTLLRVREGTFDLYQLKPHPAILVGLCNGFGCDGLGILIGGIGISGAALAHLPPVSPAAYFSFCLLLIFSLLVLLSSAIIIAALLFKWIGNSRVFEIAESVALFGQYPISIFSKSFANFLTWILPVSMIAFIPASALLGRPIAYLLPAILASLFFFAISLVIWRMLKKSYTSAGG